MNTLTTVSTASVPASFATGAIDAALAFAEQGKSASIRHAHRSDWRIAGDNQILGSVTGDFRPCPPAA